MMTSQPVGTAPQNQSDYKEEDTKTTTNQSYFHERDSLLEFTEPLSDSHTTSRRPSLSTHCLAQPHDTCNSHYHLKLILSHRCCLQAVTREHTPLPASLATRY